MKQFIGVTGRESIRKILMNIFTKELALKYSYTGLDKFRQKTKFIFSQHPICRFILGKKIGISEYFFENSFRT